MASLSGSPGMSVGQRIRSVRNFDWFLLLSAALLILVGLMSLYSEGYGLKGGGKFTRQLLNAGIGLIPFSIFAFIHPKTWMRAWQGLYIFNLLVLAAVLKLGHKAGGAQRWIQVGPIEFQPSEMAKLFLVLTLASFFAMRQEQMKSKGTFLLSIVHLAMPAALVLMQPHLGACLVLMVIWLSISLAAEVPLKFIGGALLGALCLVLLAFAVPSLRGKLLHGYQDKRVKGMFQNDQQGMNYQTLRAEIAFGRGGVMGTGFLHGEEKQGRYIPEQHTDFIFTVIGEEGGLIGSSLVLIGFGFFFFRIWLVMLRATDPFYKMVAAGLLGMLAFHTIVNLGMVLQLLPVVGLWLPFMSYGGTAMWLCMASVGLLLNIRSRERSILF